uniref:NADH dehydrogenase subunit 6 n=1 Tax=Halter nutans TaxID=1593350 RepID=UPI003002F457|nr:NADH dehydrogenase subunit 6 [Halter nutans]
MYFLNMLNIIMSINFINIKHPLAMGLMLLIQTIIVSMICGMFSYSYWFSYILFLIMLGGMLVLFIYMTSLASNELFSMSMKWMILSTLIVIFMTMSFFFIDQMMLNHNNFEMINNEKLNLFLSEDENNLIKLYNNPTMNITIMMMNFLLLTLIIIVKITKISHGPLRQMN